ncbi:hypothetical protein EAG_03117 [Camponotus floridanus]|uniref:Uncharacterized protein n=1 Tax=Camponotus floridanus TaxID=104421 RepID=E2AKQ6_CAMFO|nr:hypothetical protein EAG_03117 [Camponotus floridanus]
MDRRPPIDNRFHLPSWRPLASPRLRTVFDSSPIDGIVTPNKVRRSNLVMLVVVSDTLRANPLPGSTDDGTCAGKTAEMQSRHISEMQRDKRLDLTRRPRRWRDTSTVNSWT